MDAAIIGGGLAAAAVMAGFVKQALRDQPPTEPDPRGVHGDASVARTEKEVLQAGLTNKKPGGFYISHVMGGLRFQQETGCLVFGGPGTGKGVGFVITTLLDRDRTTRESILCYDPACQNLFVTGPYLQSIGYRVIYSNLIAEHSAKLRQQFGPPVKMNPLTTLRLDHPLIDIEIGETAGLLVPVKADDKQPHFAQTAQQLAAAVGLWLRETDGDKATWPKVAELIHQSPAALNAMFAGMLSSRFPTVRACGALWHREIDDKGAMKNSTEGQREVLTTCRRALAFLLNGAIADMFSGTGPDAYNFVEMKRQRTAYFLVLPETNNDSLQKCGALVLQTAKQALMAVQGTEAATLSGAESLKVLWILDEMAAALPSAASTMIQNSAALLRKYKIRIAGISQSWSQFECWAGGAQKADALRGLFGAAIYYGANDNTSIAHIMQECCHYTDWQPSTNPLAEAGVEGTTGAIKVPLFHPEDIRGMISQGRQIISLIGSRQIVVLPRANYRAIPQLKARAAADPYHPEQKTKKEA